MERLVIKCNAGFNDRMCFDASVDEEGDLQISLNGDCVFIDKDQSEAIIKHLTDVFAEADAKKEKKEEADFEEKVRRVVRSELARPRLDSGVVFRSF